MVFCIPLILLMQAGFALAEAGMTRARTTAEIMLRTFASLSIGGLVFWAVGFGLMFGSHFLVNPTEDRMYALVGWQILAAATVVSITFGATAERMRFGPALLYVVLMAAVIYPGTGYWTWGHLLVASNVSQGFVDFAGSAVVHCVAGFSALAAAMAVGPRLGKFGREGAARVIPGHDLNFASLGVLILFFGWFGFTGAAAEFHGASAGRVALNTLLAGLAGAAGSIIAAFVKLRTADLGLTLSGTLGGLVAICASCEVASAPAAVGIGLVAGVLVVFSVLLFERARVDDPTGAVSVHGVCGAFGTLIAAAFSAHPGDQVGTQGTVLVALFVWSFGLTFGAFKLMDLFFGVRVSTEEEIARLEAENQRFRSRSTAAYVVN